MQPGIEAQLHLAAGPQQVARLELDEALSAGIVARVEIAGGADLQLEQAAGQDAALVILRDGDEIRRWALYVTRVRCFAGTEDGLVRYRVELRDKLWRLELGRSIRKFRNRTVEAMVDAVLAEHGLEARWNLRNPTAARNYTVQYRESHRHFVSRLLEQEGIYFSVSADGALMAADASPSSPWVPGAESVPIIEAAAALTWAGDGVHDVRRSTYLASGAMTLNDFNWKNPRVDLLSASVAQRDRDLEIYDYPAGYRDQAEGRRLAELRLEATRAMSSRLDGHSNVIAFAPGFSFELTGEAAGAYSGPYFLVRVIHRMETTSFAQDDEERTYDNEIVAIPRAVPFRPELVHTRPTVDGHHTALVRGPAGEEIHTDTHGRFKAQFHWDREARGTDEDSRWLRIMQECASSMSLARVGWEMSVAYVDGDPERPLGIARQINGLMTPTYSQPANKTMMAIKTPSSPATGGYNELKLDDRGGAMRFDLRAEKDLQAIVKNDRTEQIGNDELHVVGLSSTRAVVGNQTVAIGGNSSSTVNADDGLAVTGNRAKKVGGNENVDVGATDTEKTIGSDKESVGTLRLTVAGGVGLPSAAALKSRFIPSPKSAAAAVAIGAAKGGDSGGGAAGAGAGAAAAAKGLVPKMPTAGDVVAMMLKGSIQRSAATNVTRMVGGAMVSAAVGPMSSAAQLAWVETVGGAKITVAGGDITTGAGKGLVTTVGGLMIRTAKDDMGFTSKLARIQVGGIAKLTATQAIGMKAVAIQVVAAASLVLESGALGLKLLPSKTAIKGDLKVDAGASIKVTGGPVNLTK